MNNVQFEALMFKLNTMESKMNTVTIAINEMSSIVSVLAQKAVFTGDAAETIEQLQNKIAALADEMGA